MTYFDMFPNIYYSAKGDGKFTIMKDIMSRVKLIAGIKENILGFDYYDVQDGETPEMIAHRYYGDVNLHWTILVANDIVDYYEDWPMSTQRFEEFVKEKYENPGAIHHYEITQSSGPTTGNGPDDYSHKIEVNSTESGAESISNYEYERREQDKKRNIKLLDPRYLPMFLEEFERLIRR